ncbi:nucleotidyltransferase domain-containing protein [Shimia ponticola]|uniref:nucleotidyltransferase domain-containing protein n=1 Tax=Shimia ponticola TaxID=2582893 RepID=UPI00210253F3|nr:nucleotidyltransferase family protein [Shimia ponticola]
MIPADTQLALACCRWPRTDRSAQTTVEQAIARITDWDQAMATLHRHRVIPLACMALQQHQAVPRPVKDRLAKDMIRQSRRALQQTRETAQVAARLEAAGCQPIVLKGAVLGQLAFGNPLLKTSWDIDIYVPRSQAPQAMACLQDSAGYRHAHSDRPLTRKQAHALTAHVKDTALRSPDGLVLELHWSLTGSRHLLGDLEDQPRTQSVLLQGGGAVRTFADDQLFAYLCLHGALHRWGRLKWLAEVHAFWRGMDRAGQAACLATAQDLGAETAVLEALHLCHEFLEGPLPSEARTAEHPPSLPVARAGPLASPYAPDTGNPWHLARNALRNLRHHRHYHDADIHPAKRQFRALQNPMISEADVLLLPLPQRAWWAYWVMRLPGFVLRRIDGVLRPQSSQDAAATSMHQSGNPLS